MLRIEKVSKSYGNKVAIKDISFTVPTGSVFGLLGPNGAGKSTLIRIINQIIAADTGKVYINNEEINPSHISLIGYMPEERGLYKQMKVGEQVLYLARLKGLSKTTAIALIKDWFDRLDMTPWWDKKVETLSKGMQQKVQFVSTVLHQPKLIILDEPFSGFDPVNAEMVKDELLKLRGAGSTIMLSTHRMENVEELCDNIAMIHKSQLVIQGKISDVKNQFKTNQYEISYSGNALESEHLGFQRIEAHYDQESNFFTERFALGTQPNGNALLAEIMKERQVISFREVLPTIGEIFVKMAKD